jgi:hypothetical protein
MDEELVRQELPIQSVRDRGDNCTATVPVHLDILSLPHSIRTHPETISNARSVVGDWYNEDMEYYLAVLKREEMDLPWLKGYETFSNEWGLESVPDNGFLKLLWHENGKTHSIQYISPIVVLQNQHTEDGEFCTPEYCRKMGLIEILYRKLKDPEGVNMSPEKMLRYGKRSNLTRFCLEKGVAEVVANAFCSDYYDNMAKTLLLRDFAVFYLNRLLSVAKSVQQN